MNPRSNMTPPGPKTCLGKLIILIISEEFAKKLEADLKEVETGIAIDSMTAGKPAGPDGIPIDPYKKKKTRLLKPLLEMFLEAFCNSSLPRSMTGGLITLLKKMCVKF